MHEQSCLRTLSVFMKRPSLCLNKGGQILKRGCQIFTVRVLHHHSHPGQFSTFDGLSHSAKIVAEILHIFGPQELRRLGEHLRRQVSLQSTLYADNLLHIVEHEIGETSWGRDTMAE